MFTCSLCFIVSQYDSFLLQYSTHLSAAPLLRVFKITAGLHTHSEEDCNIEWPQQSQSFEHQHRIRTPFLTKPRGWDCGSRRFSGLFRGWSSSNCSLILKARVITLTKPHGTCKPDFWPIFLFWFGTERWPFTHKCALHGSLEHAHG